MEEGGKVIFDATQPVMQEELEAGFWRWSKVGRIVS